MFNKVLWQLGMGEAIHERVTVVGWESVGVAKRRVGLYVANIVHCEIIECFIII